jgi:hypothetical protein
MLVLVNLGYSLALESGDETWKVGKHLLSTWSFGISGACVLVPKLNDVYDCKCGDDGCEAQDGDAEAETEGAGVVVHLVGVR